MITLTDLFCGAGGSSTGAVQVPGVAVRVASNHWKLAVDTHEANHPDTGHVCADLSQIDPRYYPRTDILWASPECFTAGHLVMTARGQVPIELVEVGDVVLTHRNRWREVVRIQARESTNLVTVKGQGHTGITTTATHRFWARPSAMTWANDIRRYRRTYAPASWIEAADLVDRGALWGTPTTPDPLTAEELPPVFAQSDNGWWLLGRWLGDGSLSFGRNHEVTITCGFHETADLEPVLADTGVRWHRSNKRTAAVYSVGCLESRDWLMRNCGHGAANKQLPPWTFTLGTDERRALLDGYMSADGGATQRRHRASTASRALAVTVRLLAESLGHRVSMAFDNRTAYTIEGRTSVARRQWIVHWEPGLSDTRAPEAFEDDGHAWSRVRSVVHHPDRTETVYNIEVAEDHSYVLDGIVVKNCTNHSIAKGARRAPEPDLFNPVPDAAAERSRATMWDVPRFTEIHRYAAVIVENVVDVARWAPYRAWLMAMDDLGYEHEVVYMNSMHAWERGDAAPQSRDRFYAVFWRKGNRRPDLQVIQQPPAWCPEHGAIRARKAWKTAARAGRYRAQYRFICPEAACRGRQVEPQWLPAASIIDWSDLGTRIGDRARPLAEKTMRRIQTGIDRYWAGQDRDPLIVNHVSGGDGRRSTSVREVTPTMVAGGLHASLLVPVEGREGKAARLASEPYRTQTARNETGLLVPAGGTWNDTARGLSEPARTRTARETEGVAFPPFITELRGGGSDVRSVEQPLATLTASGTHHGLTTAGRTPSVEDCSFRMLSPNEIQQAMAFPAEYRILGTKRDQVRMAGNAVTPPAARDLVGAVAASLA